MFLPPKPRTPFERRRDGLAGLLLVLTADRQTTPTERDLMARILSATTDAELDRLESQIPKR